MPLTTALFTGLSGLTVSQTALDVIGNNIANVNTTAFKSSRALLDPQFTETSNFGSPPSGTFGGSNPTQKGLGAIVSSIQRSFASGNIQTTGLKTDLAVQGLGMFIVQGSERMYTRNGTFQLSSQNFLTTANGMYVMGYGVDPNFNVVQGELQTLEIPLGLMTTAQPTSRVELGGSLRSSGEIATSGSTMLSQEFTNALGGAVDGTTLLTDLRDGGSQSFYSGTTLTMQGQRGGRLQAVKTLDVTGATTVDDLMQFLVDGFGIHDDASLAPAGAQVVASGGGYAIEITGNYGDDNALSLGTGGLLSSSPIVPGPLLFTETAPAAGESVYTSMTVYDSLGNPLGLNLTFVLESRDNTTTTWHFFANSPDDTDSSSALGDGTVTFDTTGKYLGSTGATVAIDRAAQGVVTPLTINLNMNNVQGMTVLAGDVSAVYQDGSPAGTLNDFSVSNDGTIIGTFSNGITRTLGQVAIATFSNYQGLIEAGSGAYKAGPNSGVPVIGIPLQSGAGAIIGGGLETSNVDISREFINMIIVSTGFSASSRVITTSNQLLTELLGVMR